MQHTAPSAPESPASGQDAPRVSSADLFRGQRTVEIDHGEQRYTLRLTRDNKLILTK